MRAFGRGMGGQLGSRGRRGRLAALPVAVVLATACAGGQTVPPAEGPGPRAPGPGDATRNAAVDTAGTGVGEARTGEARTGEAAEREGRRSPTAADRAERTAEAIPADSADSAPGFFVGGGDSAGLAMEPASPEMLPVPILPGALLPATRIVAFYGNPASTTMGILGELPPDQMLERLDAEVTAWREADPLTPVRPALQIIAVMATGDPGRDSLFRLRMPDYRIQQVYDWAKRRNGLLFLDVQPGRSTVEEELQPLETWLTHPDVHLALDPEWAMPPDGIPGRQIGSLTADDINYAIDWLADIVERYHLPPKVLVVHRFTSSMVQRATEIHRDPRVQVVINMDGWGAPPHKRAAYRDIVAPEADQFTGFKLFFHNDRRDGSELLTPTEILELDPAPVYIQYQ